MAGQTADIITGTAIIREMWVSSLQGDGYRMVQPRPLASQEVNGQ
jgi:hypothetical protein